jgi:hypothetical protein
VQKLFFSIRSLSERHAMVTKDALKMATFITLQGERKDFRLWQRLLRKF